MASIKPLKCPTCGGTLYITGDIDRFVCGFCKNEHIVERSGGVITIKAVKELERFGVVHEKLAAERAIQYSTEKISSLQSEQTQLQSQIQQLRDAQNVAAGIQSIKSQKLYSMVIGLILVLIGLIQAITWWPHTFSQGFSLTKCILPLLFFLFAYLLIDNLSSSKKTKPKLEALNQQYLGLVGNAKPDSLSGILSSSEGNLHKIQNSIQEQQKLINSYRKRVDS
jgi:hypothetical protein